MKSLMLKYVWVTVITIKYRRYLSACAKMLGSLVAKNLLYWMFYTSDGVRRHCIKWYWKERSYWIVFCEDFLVTNGISIVFSGFRFRMMLQHFKWITTFFVSREDWKKNSINSFTERRLTKNEALRPLRQLIGWIRWSEIE